MEKDIIPATLKKYRLILSGTRCWDSLFIILKVLTIIVALSACQMSKKKLNKIKKDTSIENPYEIVNLPVQPTSEQEGKENTKVEDKDFHDSGPTVVKKKINNKSSATEKTKEITSPKASISTSQLKKIEEESRTMAKNFPFKVGEKIVFSVQYFAMEAGRFTFEVKPAKEIQSKPVFHFYVSAHTSSLFAWVYKLEDFAESFWDMGLKRPFLMKIYGTESRFIREVQTVFDWKKKEAKYQAKIMDLKKGLDEEEKTWALTDLQAQDVVSSLYYLRTKDFAVGKTFNFNVAERGKNIPLRATVVREELLKTKLGAFNTYVVQPSFSSDGAWKQKGDITLWFTKDENKTPIQFEAKIKVGTIRGRLFSLTK